jgi:hypothetical protein
VRRGLKPEDLGDLLTSKLSCTLATYRRGGDAHLSPVWFHWDGKGFNIALGRDGVMAEHLRRDPRAGVLLYESEMPLRGIEMHGTGTLFDEGVHELRRHIWRRYVGVEPPGRDEGEIGLRVEGAVRAWDFADDLEEFGAS